MPAPWHCSHRRRGAASLRRMTRTPRPDGHPACPAGEGEGRAEVLSHRLRHMDRAARPKEHLAHPNDHLTRPAGEGVGEAGGQTSLSHSRPVVYM
eukprot:58503-Chlamydomonas_euryale.AAC.9